jgi:hypothetical protein
VVALILSEINMNNKAQVITKAVMVKLDIQIEALKKETSTIMAMIRRRHPK